MCDSKDLIIGYLYDELTETERRAMDAHLASCAECREEIAGLRDTRVALASWTPAEPELGFQIVTRAAAPTPRAWLRPAWGLAAAAVLVLAAGAAIANLDIRYGSDGLTIRTGWAPRVADQAQATGDAAGPPPAASGDALAQFERRLQSLEASAAARAEQPAVRQAAYGPRASDAEILREVKLLLGQSESRQQRELALRVGQVIGDFERQRRIDLATIQQGLQSATGANEVVHRQMLDYVSGLYRVAQQVR